MDENKNDFLMTNKFKEFLVLLSGSAGILVAFLWLTGRSFATGYFEAMGIPSYQITFSVWEYAEASWSHILLISPIFIYFLVIVVVVVGFVSLLLDKLANSVKEKRKNRKKRKQTIFTKVSDFLTTLFDNTLDINTKLNNLAIIVLALLFFVALTMSYVRTEGGKNGYNYVNGAGVQLNFTTNAFLDLGNRAKVSQNFDVFSYEGYRLLTYNDGKYYFFDEIDPETCKPKKVFVVNDDVLLRVSFAPMPVLSNACPLFNITEIVVEIDPSP